jgi:hypothetical protein
MGHLQPPNLNCYALDHFEFWPLIFKTLKFMALFWLNMSNYIPQTKFLATPLNPLQSKTKLNLFIYRMNCA